MADTILSALTQASSLALTDELLQVKVGGDLRVPVSLVASALGDLRNASSANQSPTAGTDTVLTGSVITFPANLPNALSVFKWKVMMTKTAAGTVGPIFKIRMGTAGTTADATIITLTFAAGTAVADNAWVEVFAIMRTVGAGTSAVMAADAVLHHNLAATGWGTVAVQVLDTVVSSGFNSTTPTKASLALTPGASHVTTVKMVQAELKLGP